MCIDMYIYIMHIIYIYTHTMYAYIYSMYTYIYIYIIHTGRHFECQFLMR